MSRRLVFASTIAATVLSGRVSPQGAVSTIDVRVVGGVSWANSVARQFHGAAGISIGLGCNVDDPGDQVLYANSRDTLPLNNPSGCVLAAATFKNGAVSRLTTNGSENGLAASERGLRGRLKFLRSRFLPGDIPLEILVSPN